MTLKLNAIPNKKSSIVEFLNNINGTVNISSIIKPNQANTPSLAPVFIAKKSFPKKYIGQSFYNVFKENEEILKSKADILDTRKNFESLEKWTNNLEQAKSK